MKLAKNFTYEEMACPCCNQCNMHPALIRALQLMRDSLERPFIINSGYRCDRHNKFIKGKPTSRHLIGAAVDLSIKGWSAYDLHYLLFELTSIPIGNNKLQSGVGIYKNHIHFQIGPIQALWINL